MLSLSLTLARRGVWEQFAEEVKPAVEGAVAPTGKEATLALFRDAQAMGGMQQAYLSPSSEDQARRPFLQCCVALLSAPTLLLRC